MNSAQVITLKPAMSWIIKWKNKGQNKKPKKTWVLFFHKMGNEIIITLKNLGLS